MIFVEYVYKLGKKVRVELFRSDSPAFLGEKIEFGGRTFSVVNVIKTYEEEGSRTLCIEKVAVLASDKF